MKLVFTKKHEELLTPMGMTLAELQELDTIKPMEVNALISQYLTPIIVGDDEEKSELADDLITMIREWLPGQTEAEYTEDL